MTATRTVIGRAMVSKNVVETLFWGDCTALSYLTLGQVRLSLAASKNRLQDTFEQLPNDNTRRSSFALTCC